MNSCNEKYTRAVGTKFYADGTLRRFPGNTIVSMSTEEPVFTELIRAQQQFKDLPFSSKFSFLPPSSFHMTVMELLCDEVRNPEHWSSRVPKDAAIEDVDDLMRDFVKDVEFPDELTMRLLGITLGLSILVRLNPADEANSELLTSFRAEVAEKTGVRFPNHDSYKYHITLAYNIEYLTEEERSLFAVTAKRVEERLRNTMPTFTLPRPRYVLFEDMGEFQPFMQRGAQNG